jgi:hypothetical protein
MLYHKHLKFLAKSKLLHISKLGDRYAYMYVKYGYNYSVK